MPLSPSDISAKFRKSLPASRHQVLRAAGLAAQESGAQAYLVGGIVRDIALDYPDTDLDIVVEGDALAVARMFAARVRGQAHGVTKFGTCKVEAQGLGTVDFATARSETYEHPGALPRTRPADIQSDLVRRDFTINAMALALNPSRYGELLDPCGGLADLETGRLRVMHGRSFIDDPTRILRGARFAARYGFRFERRTRSLAQACLADGGLGSISGKRVFRELSLICMEPRALRGLRLLDRQGILGLVFGRRSGARKRQRLWGQLGGAAGAIGRSAGRDFARAWVVWFASCFVGLGRKRAGQLAISFNLAKDVRSVCLWTAADHRRTGARLGRLNREQAYRVKRLLDAVPAESLVILYADSGRAGRKLIRTYFTTWRKVSPLVTGEDMASLGIGQGPAVGAILDRIVRLKLAGLLTTREAELAYVQRAAKSRDRC
ncbi:MAG TPA: hypothetical protein VMU02_12240 [bacterium]|nr:hypothetical protein [bacterium]